MHFVFKFSTGFTCGKSISKKILAFASFAQPRNAITLQHLIIQSTLCYLSNGRLLEVKNKTENFTLLALKVVTVACESWSLTRGFKYNDLT